MKKLLIMTVAYNEEKKIGGVLEGIKKTFLSKRKLYQRNIMLEHA